MSTSAVITMIVVLGTVIGGFVVLLGVAIHKENGKNGVDEGGT